MHGHYIIPIRIVICRDLQYSVDMWRNTSMKFGSVLHMKTTDSTHDVSM